MDKHKYQRYPGDCTGGRIVYKSAERAVLRVQPKDTLRRPMYLMFVTTTEPETDDYYVFSDDGIHYRMPRKELDT